MGYDELIKAHALYESKYGNKFYNIALKVCQRGGTDEKTTAVISFLLYFNRVWYTLSDEGKNAFYNLENHVSDIYNLIATTEPISEELKQLILINTDLNDIFIENSIKTLYKRFSEVFGATGASKALHLLNPRLFVMWDENIRRNYHINTPDEYGYLHFLRIVKEELMEFVEDCANKKKLTLDGAQKFIEDKTGMKLTKLIDELNYLKFTRKELSKEFEQEIDDSDKIRRILEIIDEIVKGAYEASEEKWVIKTNRSGMVRASADKLKSIIEGYGKKGDLEGILNYLYRVQGDSTGREVHKILKACGKKTVEDVYDEVVKIAK